MAELSIEYVLAQGNYLVRTRGGARLTSGRSYRSEPRRALGLGAASEA